MEGESGTSLPNVRRILISQFSGKRQVTRAELEGFGIDPYETRQMWQEAIGHVVGCWTNEEYEFDGEYWQMPRRRVQPKPLQQPHPPLWGATSSEDGHRQIGALGLGLCSFAVGVPPEEVQKAAASVLFPEKAVTRILAALLNVPDLAGIPVFDLDGTVYDVTVDGGLKAVFGVHMV